MTACRRAVPVLFCAFGMLLVFGPMLLGGLTYTLGNIQDGRLIAFLLEHGYGWLVGEELHRDLWRAPMFHPYDKTTTLSDVMLGFGPFYWPWRALGFAADTSFQLWMLVVASLNFAVAYVFVVRFVRVGVLGASVGAYLFAFGNPKLVQFNHQQLAPLFYVLVAMICLHAVLVQAGATRSAWRERLWIGAFFGSLIGQAYGAFYPFFFFGLVLAAATPWAALSRASRAAGLGLVRRRWAWIALCTLLSALALAPLVARYAATMDEVGGYAYHAHYVPVPESWLLMGRHNLLYGWLLQLEPFARLRSSNQANGIGLVTTAACLAGLWLARRTPGVRILALATGTVVLGATSFGGFSAWSWVYAHLPGGTALRAIGRVGMIVLPLAALGVAVGIDHCVRARRRVVGAVLVGVLLVEQLHPVDLVDKHVLRAHIDALAARVDPDGEAFFLVCTQRTRFAHTNDEALWVALQSGKPTVNGHSGNNPPGWRMNRLLRSDTPESRSALRDVLRLWCGRHGLDPDRVQWIEVRGIEIEPMRHVLGVRLEKRSW